MNTSFKDWQAKATQKKEAKVHAEYTDHLRQNHLHGVGHHSHELVDINQPVPVGVNTPNHSPALVEAAPLPKPPQNLKNLLGADLPVPVQVKSLESALNVHRLDPASFLVSLHELLEAYEPVAVEIHRLENLRDFSGGGSLAESPQDRLVFLLRYHPVSIRVEFVEDQPHFVGVGHESRLQTRALSVPEGEEPARFLQELPFRYVVLEVEEACVRHFSRCDGF